MLSGFNTNFRYRGVLFHVQTEDSGRGKPHVITHLFHGGNIIASEKREYSDLLASEGVEGAVRKLMEEQHKAMLRRLSRGEHDSLIEQRLGPGLLSASSVSETGRLDPVAPLAAQPGTVAPEAPGSSKASPVAEPTCIVPDEDPAATRLARVFGDRVVSEKPLDEVVLDYLVENARKRKRSGR